MLQAFLEVCFPTMPIINKARRRKIQVAEGKIFTTEEGLERIRQDITRAALPKRGRGRPGRWPGRGGPLDFECDRSIVTGTMDQFLTPSLAQSNQEDQLST